MAKARSPQYPSISLKEAVEKVRLVFERDYQNAVPRQVVAAHMGYQSLNGKSLGVLAALGKYGLLEGRGNETRVSDLAVQILAHPVGDPARSKAIVEAASKPELFAELESRFQGKVSDQALRSYLITQKFIPPAADAAIRAYRDTKWLVQNEGSGYDNGVVDEDPVAMQDTVDTAPVRQSAAAPPPAPLPDTEPFRVSFSPGGIDGVFRISTPEDAEELIRAINALKLLFKPLGSAGR